MGMCVCRCPCRCPWICRCVWGRVHAGVYGHVCIQVYIGKRVCMSACRCVWACMYAGVRVGVYGHVCRCAWRPEVDVKCLSLLLYFKNIFVVCYCFLNYVHVCVSVCGLAYVSTVTLQSRRGHGSPETTVTSVCELPNVGTHNQIQKT